MKKRIISIILSAAVFMIGSTGCGIQSSNSTSSSEAPAAEAPISEETDVAVQAESYDMSPRDNSYAGDMSAKNESYDHGLPSQAEVKSDAVYEETMDEAPAFDIGMAEEQVLDGYSGRMAGKRGMNSIAAAEGMAYGYYPEEEYYYEEPEFNSEEYKYTPENVWQSPVTSPFSTFAADVDTAAYANVRRMLLRGEEVPADAVRIEEMLNYFTYDYNKPEGRDPLGVTTQIAPCPWNSENHLLLVGLRAKDIDMRERVASNLVFLVDVSGSMSDNDKLPLIQRSFRLLCEELGRNDRISIVTYASSDQVVLEGVSGVEKARINDAMEDLFASGGTNGSAGIQTAYALADKYFIKGGNNRVILATDGDLNIGMTDEGSLTRLIQDKAKSGVYLSVLGFGEGNISDTNMEALADNGNGNYSYIDSVNEARRVLIDEMGGTLFTVAKDVKLQVEFNPEYIKGYRLIGYENRQMAAESFADDSKDGGEIGAGHCVTALYEIAGYASGQEVPSVTSKYTQKSKKIQPFESISGELLTVSVRYKDPAAADGKSLLMEYPVDRSSVSRTMSDDMSWAAGVAQIGMLMKDSPYAGDTDVREVLDRMSKTKAAANDDYRKEFLYVYGRL